MEVVLASDAGKKKKTKKKQQEHTVRNFDI